MRGSTLCDHPVNACYKHWYIGMVRQSLMRLIFSFQTFIKRFRKIMDSSQNAANEDASVLTSKLDHIERQVFSAGRKGVREFLQWEAGITSKLTTSETVVNHKKRKRSMIE